MHQRHIQCENHGGADVHSAREENGEADVLADVGTGDDEVRACSVEELWRQRFNTMLSSISPVYPKSQQIIQRLLNLTYGKALIQFNRANSQQVVKFRALYSEPAEQTHCRSRSFQ